MSASQLMWPAGGALPGGQFQLLRQFNESDVRNGSVRVVARAPSGQTSSLNIHLDPSGQYKTDFTPNEVGDWSISILYDGQNIQGSPFNVRVQDPSKVRVYGIHSSGSIGKELSFSVDTSGAGEGEITVEVIHEGRAIGTDIARHGNTYRVGFMPEGTGVYAIYVYFNRMDVPGSPFTIQIANPAVVTADGDGLSIGMVGQKCSFVVTTSQSSTPNDMTIRVKSPKGVLIPNTISPYGNGAFNVDFTPQQVGPHNVEVQFHGSPVNGSPFTCQVFDPTQIIVTNLHGTVVVGKLVEFDIDANESGNGKLEILVNDGEVPCKVETVGNRQYHASFKPTEPKLYQVTMTFNGFPVDGSPWTVNVLDADNVHTTVEKIKLVPVNFPAAFEVHSADDGTIEAKVTTACGKLVPVCIEQLSLGLYCVQFTPTDIGMHKIAVKYEGLAIPNSPFEVMAFDPSAVKVSPITAVAVDNVVEFTVDASNAGAGDVTIVVNDGAVPSNARKIGQNVYAVSFTPTEPGYYSVELFFNEYPIKDSPVMVPVVDASLVHIHGKAPFSAINELAVITVDTHSAGPACLCATVRSPCCRDVHVDVTERNNGCYDIEFTPTEVGSYQVTIEYGGQQVPGSPVEIAVYDVSRIRVMGVRDGMIGHQSCFVVDLNKCGEGELGVCILSETGHPVLNEVGAIEPGRLDVKYSPTEAGPHFAEVTFNCKHVPGSPFRFNVHDCKNVTTRGDGLRSVECGRPTSFVITAPDAKIEDIDVHITGPNGREILPTLTETKASNFLAEYTPTMAGHYAVVIRYRGCEIPNSPFTVQCWDASRVLIANVKQCEVCCDCFFNIEMGDAGDGTIEISISGPTGQLIPNDVVTASPGLLEVHFVPTMSGLHRASVTYNGTSIPGSPAEFSVVDPSKVVVRGDGLGSVQCSRQAVFMISAPDAQLRDLEVAVVGPNGKHLVPCVREIAQGNFRVDYMPTIVGDYLIHVCCFGKQAACSPYTAKAWDASRVLVADVSMGQVGVESSFKVVVADAGDGVLEVTMADSAGHLLANQAVPVEQGVLEVVYTPKMAGLHRGNVVFNRETVPGSPFTFLVIDTSAVSCWGDGLQLVPVNKLASFTVTAPLAQVKDVGVRIIGPSGNEVMSRLLSAGNGSFRVDYTPPVAGQYMVNVLYFGKQIPCCPLPVSAWDVSKIRLSPAKLAFVNIQSDFTVDAREAGEGKLDVVISGPQNQRINCDINSDGRGAYMISYIPLVSGLHRADVTFNGDVVPGSPMTFVVADPDKVAVTGDGLDKVRCNKTASFVITSPAAQQTDLEVSITGPQHKAVSYRMFESGIGKYTVEYTPTVPGDYVIVTKYFGSSITGSPFVAHAWDPAGVSVSNMCHGIINKPYTFEINATNAGNGSLEISVQCRNETVPNVARSVGKTGMVEVTFTPKCVEPHQVTICFNGEPIPGSPFIVPIIDGSLATANGFGVVGPAIAHRLTCFNVVTTATGGEADLSVAITTPSCGPLTSTIEGSHTNGFTVSYTPIEAGLYSIAVKYAEVPIHGSPFCVEVFDPCAVLLCGQLPCIGRICKPVSIRVDASCAGRGLITSQVKGPSTHPGVSVMGSASGIAALSFIPVETGEHMIFICFNGIDIPGSPFCLNVMDPKKLDVNWDAVNLRSVGEPIEILFKADHVVDDADLVCTVTDPSGHSLAVNHASKDLVHGFMFVGETVGPHLIDLQYCCEAVPGSPHTCNVYDVERVRLLDVSPCANMGDEVSFTVDTSEAGMGEVEAEVTQGTTCVPLKRQVLSTDQIRYTFIAMSPKDHHINVTFNGQKIPACPLVLRIVNPASKMLLTNGNATRCVPVGETVWACLSQPGYPILPQDVTAIATAPNGEQLPVAIIQQADGGIKLEYHSKFTGPHSLHVCYAGQEVPGSPLVTLMYDVCQVFVEGIRTARIGEVVPIDVKRFDAGEAELVVTITDPQGDSVPFEVCMTECGESLTYIPEMSGTYLVNVTFGGLTVPGCPIRQEIKGAPKVTARGPGLERGIVDKQAEFVVDVKGERGELYVEIQGPNSIANNTIEPDGSGLLKVKYIPVEVGIFTVILDWSGQSVTGSPYHPKVIDPSKVDPIRDDEKWTASDHLKVKINELETIIFDCKNAGPGQFKAIVEGPDGDVNADVLPVGTDQYAVKFVPRKKDDYFIRAYWSDTPINTFPIIAKAMNEINPQPEPPCCIEIRPDLVSVHGPGISTGHVLEPSDFVVDGHEAGPGELSIQMVGLKCDIPVACVQLSDYVFGCTYVPELQGAYLLNVLWCGMHVTGSPFKVSVVSGADATKVVCSGDGLTSGVVHRDSSVLIDARRAGIGEIVAECKGPNSMAYCTLLDRHDGTFELVYKPQEVGIHTLDIKYADEPVPRSPFTIKVGAAPDPSRVRVSGDGICDGILATYKSSFTVNTRGAGPGQLTVKVRGPKGKFRVEMKRRPDNERAIDCRYDPTEVGQYQVIVLWSGEHVPGSPFDVIIVDTLAQLQQLAASGGGKLPSMFKGDEFDDGASTLRMSTFSGRGLVFNDYA
jgi:filamin